jgi:hypothetical protein
MKALRAITSSVQRVGHRVTESGYIILDNELDNKLDNE